MPYMYALYVCLICMPYTYKKRVWHFGIRLYMSPYMHDVYVCLICMPYMYALCVCLLCMPIRMPYMYALYEQGTRFPFRWMGKIWVLPTRRCQRAICSPLSTSLWKVKRDLLMRKRDLLMSKRDLLMRKRDLLMSKRDLLMRKRDLLMRKRDLWMSKRGLLLLQSDLFAVVSILLKGFVTGLMYLTHTLHSTHYTLILFTGSLYFFLSV